MKYKSEWKGRLKVSAFGRVAWDGKEVGRVASVYRPGAKSPGGLVTNTVFVTSGVEFNSMTAAIESLLPKNA